MKRPEQVLARLNERFPGNQHGYRFFTAWFGIYHTPSRTLTYAAGGHSSAMVIIRGSPDPLLLLATGPVMGALATAEFPALSYSLDPGARLLVFSDGAFEIRRDRQEAWNLTACFAYLAEVGQRDGNLMDELVARARQLRGSPHLDDDFSVIEARMH
jgi:serine phosphatase RsbU (regulator of sigma subunit)